jgi:putative colanic acid biosysnthesis UDP-glucose lipid carrier transferase
MLINNEADLKQATKNDSRITRVGKFLRKSSIDEFPQFINVIFGQMSIIGPRPHPIKLNQEFASRIANIMARHYVKPGITGLAQCMGYRGETKTLTDMENRISLDRYYIENWSFWLDIKIIFLTIVSLLRGSEKAY